MAFFSGKDEKTSALLLPKIMYRCCRFFGSIAAENSAGLFAENCVVVIADYKPQAVLSPYHKSQEKDAPKQPVLVAPAAGLAITAEALLYLLLVL